MRTRIELGRIAVFALLFLWMVLMLFGCKAGEKAVAKYKASSEFPSDCADEFPTKHDTAFIAGQTVYDTTTFVEYVNVRGEDYVIEKEKIKTVTVTKRVRDTMIVKVENTARVEALTRLNDELQESYITKVAALEEQAKRDGKKIKNRTTQRNIGWGLVGLLTVFSFRKRISKMFA